MKEVLRRGNEELRLKNGFSWTVLFFHFIALMFRKQLKLAFVYAIAIAGEYAVFENLRILPFMVTISHKAVNVTPWIITVIINVLFASVANQIRIDSYKSKGFK